MKGSFVIYILLFLCFSTNAQVTCKRDTILMGSKFDITISAVDSLQAERYIDEVITEITRIENLISDWKFDSQVSEINRMAGKQAVKVDQELFDLTQRALFFSQITDGAFDISSAAMDKIWKFDGSMKQLPSKEELIKAIEKVGYQNIILNPADTTVFLKKEGMKIGFGATGKGYAADKGRNLMQQMGVKAGIVNASGDMAVWSDDIPQKKWRIGINNPFKNNDITEVVTLCNGAITTSGDYEKFAEIASVRYSHIMNPKTGMPATGLTSVTVIGPSAETANGFSTSLMVLGRKEGLRLLKKHPEYACLMITDNGRVYRSKNFKKIKQIITR
ncbi:MAG: FAD:protein FMN transferase [Myroides sp.]|nr:FAD:protein FMN transferase [Myroides sp.]